MNELANIAPLKNRYFILRHGESEANVAQLITSNPAQCIANYGLTQKGKQQVATTIEQAKSKGCLSYETIIYCSDFKRTHETAELAREVLHAEQIHSATALRERFFGAYDGKSNEAYVVIWPRNQRDKLAQQKNGAENAGEMLGRLMGLIKDLEARHDGRCLLLVSHGDPLQVLRAAFAGLEPKQSEQLPYINLTELRKLTLKPRQAAVKC